LLTLTIQLKEQLFSHPSHPWLPCTHPVVHGSARPAPSYAGGPQASFLHARRPRVPHTSPGASNGATSTPSGFLPARPDGLGHPTLTRLRRPGLGRRGFTTTLLRASTIFKAFSKSRPHGQWTPDVALHLRRAPSSRACPTFGRTAVGPREATPRSRDGQSHQGGGNPCDGARLA
jgi:hypothetical protein